MMLTDKLTRRMLYVLAITGLIFLMLSPVAVSAFAGLGGYVSEKLLGNAITTDSVKSLGDSLTGETVLGAAPVITTQPATNAQLIGGVSSATLNGNLSSLNGFPSAQVWFAWGYTAGTMSNTTVATTVLAIGDVAHDITGYDPGARVYFQMLSGTDGTAVGAVRSFVVGASGIGYYLLWNLLTVIIALGMFIIVLKASDGNWVAALISVIIGIIAIYFIRTALTSLW